MKTEDIPVEYCGTCGRKLEYMGMMGAENFGVFLEPSPSKRYDRKTGKRRMRHYVSCPNAKRAWWDLRYNWHDSHSIGKEILIENEK